MPLPFVMCDFLGNSLVSLKKVAVELQKRMPIFKRYPKEFQEGSPNLFPKDFPKVFSKEETSK